MFKTTLASLLAFTLLICAGSARAQETKSNVFDDAFDLSPVAAQLAENAKAMEAADAIVPATAAHEHVAIFGTPEDGGYTITANRGATLAIARDALSSGNWDEVVVMRPVISADGKTYTLQPVEGLPTLNNGYFASADTRQFSGFDEAEEFAYAGILFNRGGNRRQLHDCNSCQQPCQQPGQQQCNQRSRSSGYNCQNGECNLRPLHIFTHQFQYAFRRAYPKGERPGLGNRVLNFMAPRIRHANGHINCYQAQTLLARRLIAVEATAIGVTAGAGGGAALGPIFIP